MPVKYITTASGSQPLTLNMLIAAPTVIAERFLTIMRNQFVMEQILRGPFPAPGGAVQYRVSSGLFADQASSIVNPRAEIPLATATKGDLATAATSANALSVAFDWAMMEMDITHEVNRQLAVVKNTLTRDVDAKFLAAVQAAVTQTVAASFAWSSSSATIRKNINAAKLLVNLATAPGTTGTGSAASYLNYNADTIVVNPTTQADLLNSTEFLQMIYGQINPSVSIGALSELPNGKVLGLTPLVTTSMPAGTALVCERMTLGGFADRVPFGMSELYDWNPARLYRADAFRESVAFVDQPKAGAFITGI